MKKDHERKYEKLELQSESMERKTFGILQIVSEFDFDLKLW